MQEPFNVNRAALAAGIASLRRRDAVDERRRETVAAREAFAGALRDGGLDVLPSEANFVLVRLGDDRAVVERLARRGILVRPGTDFGLPGSLRVTIGPAVLMERIAGELLDAVALPLGAA